MIAISEGAWGAIIALIANAAMLGALLIRQGGAKKSLDQINLAVNHSKKGSPTLVQRVTTIEERTEQFEQDTTKHRDWEHRVFASLAAHVGFALPPFPHKSDPDPEDL
jgi:hypothetical protein